MSIPMLSDRINALVESQTIAMAKKARELASQGYEVINLSFGEPDFQTPDYIKEAAKLAIDQGFTFYTPVAGYPELRKAIAEKLVRDNNIACSAENIVVSTGAKQSIANALLCLLNPGDEVIVISPFWVSYIEMVKLAEGVPVEVMGKTENNFKPSAQDIEAKITSKTKAIIYSSPSNPTGACFTKSELEAIANMLLGHPGIFVISDEIYEYISYGEPPFSIGSIPSIKERVVTINGFSKAFAMTGWRVGYMAAEKWLADACDKMQGQITSGTCSIAQKAATAALLGDRTPTETMRNAFLKRRNLVFELFNAIPNLIVNNPDGAFYLFPDVSAYFGKKTPEGQTIANSTDLAMYVLHTAYVSIVPGEAFGNDNCIRISFAASEEQLIKAIQRISASFAALV